MNNFVYGTGPYKEAQPLPPASLKKYYRDLKNYIEYYVPGWHRRLYVTCLIRLWFWWVDFKKNAPNFQGEKRDEFLRTQEKRWYFNHSLLCLSYSMILKDDQRPLKPIERASLLIKAIFQFYLKLNDGNLEQDMIAGQAAEMGQYYNLFGCHLRPLPQDHMYRTSSSDHIIVAMRGSYFKVKMDPDSSVENIMSTLDFLDRELERESCLTPNHFGHLSVAPRSLCQKYSRLHVEVLQKMEDSLFFVSIEDTAATSTEDLFLKIQTSAFGNRWYHASLQLIVDRNSHAGMILSNRNYLDGNVGARFVDEVFYDSIALDVPQRAGTIASTEKLGLKLNENDLKLIKKSLQSYVNTRPYLFNIRAPNHPKDNLDGLFMISLLLATEKIYGRVLKSVQICNMSKYKYMGLTHAFVTTDAFHQLSNYLKKSNYNLAMARSLLLEALKTQSQAQRESRSGTWLAHYVGSLRQEHPGSLHLLLKLIGSKNIGPELLSSHMKKYSSIDYLGRPGIHLPSVKYFGLHYLFQRNHIDLIFMPSKAFAEGLDQLCAEIQKSWDTVVDLYERKAVSGTSLDTSRSSRTLSL